MRKSDSYRKMKALTASLAAGFLAFAPLAAQAGFTKTQTIDTGGRKTLYDKTIYIVDDNISVTAGAGQSAYTVNENATVVLYIPAGKKLTLKGGAGSVITGAGAGLEIPSSSTLIVVGGGTLVATGGTGGNGESGGSGGDAEVIDDDDDPHDEWGHAGKGGSGGSGGGGAGAGIGGKGGAGGAGRDEPEADWLDTDGSWTYRGYNGYIGNSGNVGNSGGKLYVLGTANVTATGGSKGADGGNAGSSGSFAREYWFYSYRAGGGGGGGGGGSGCAASAFGGGGGGGGAGGGGGEGGTYWTTQGYTERKATGGNGGGGSGGVSGSGTRTNGTSGWHDGNGGDGGIGGSSGSTGSGGTAYKSSTATVNGFSASESAESHSSIEYTITFDDGWRISKTATAKYGFALPAGPMASRYGYIFTGWYTGVNGTGTRYYDANGASTVSLWTHPGDLTLYPGWEVNDHESLDEVALTVNGVAVSEGTDVSGTGWSYSAASGRIDITGADSTYEIAGKDLHGFAPIFVSAANCTIKITDELQMAPGGREGYNPITVQSGASLTLEAAEGGACSLEGADGRTSVSVATGATLTLKTEGWLTATGGDDAADIGLDKDASSCGNIYIETYANWFARFRPGHGLSENNGLLNNLGKSANFISASTGGTLWSVRMPELEDAVMYLQRIDGDRHDAVQPGADGYAWFWVPTGGYEWAKRLDASLSAGDKLWICYVESQHSIASVFYPLHIEIDGEDIAHLNGKGWYATLSGSDGGVVEGTKASLVITDAGPHVVTGYGNAGIDIRADTSLTISNLTLTTSSWENKYAMWIEDGRTLNLTVVGDNRLTSGVNCPGIAVYPNRTINIDGDGSLRAQGGKNAAGIGGGYFDTCAGTINIKGGTITAIGGANAAGIGGGQTTRKSGTVTIAGGKVTARGGQYGAAIGGGYKGYADVVITGGTVFPTAGSKASAIGAGYSAGSVTVSEMIDVAAVYTTADKVSPSAKNGAGDAVFPVTFDFGVADCRITDLVINKVSNACNDIWTNEKGELVLWLTSTSGDQRTITIVGVDEDGNEIKKSWGVSIDGSGDYKFSRDIITVDGEPVVGGIDADGPGWDYFADTSIMTFRSGSHTLGGSSTNGSIRIVVAGDDVALTVQKLTLKTPYDKLSPFVVSNRCTLTLADENIFEGIYNPNGKTSAQKGSEYTAGLEVPAGASLTIEGDGTLTAIGGWCGAGIGSRGTGYESAGSITINGGYIYAIGGDGSSGGGAGIGGGLGGGVERITINGGYVDAQGGKSCCGIGGGYGNKVRLADGVLRVTGGTVLASRGDEAFNDFVMSVGNTVGTRSIVIDGASSVRPKNGVVTSSNPYPDPVSSNGVSLVYAMIVGLGPGDELHMVDYLWPQYDDANLIVDDDGAVCLWGERTNAVRVVEVESPNIPGGMMTFEHGAATNSIIRISSDYEAPDSRIINGVTCWRVVVGALPARKHLDVAGIDRAYSRGTTVSDSTGVTHLYLPNGEYDFTVGGYAYHAAVSDAVSTATFTVGIFVDGVDIGAGGGEGWSYSGTDETLSLNSAREYAISGTNTERRVSVCAAASGVKIRADRLELAPAGRGAFYAANGVPSFEYAGGTLGTGEIPSQMVVSGGSIDASVMHPFAKTGDGVLTNAYCVTIDGLPRFAKIDIANIEGLENYDTQGIYANEYGEVYLYLPDGDYWFGVSDGATTSEKIAIVDGEASLALNYDPTGVCINGRDAARLRGDGWLNEDGLVRLLAATDYVLSGTNGGPAVTFQAQTSRTTLVFDNLVMTNAAMEVSPVSVGSGQKATFTVELRGTNILHGVSSDAWCGVEMLQMTELNFIGDGYLEATGQGPGIGMGRGEVADMSSIVIHSGTIVATGGGSAAGIGGGGGQDGIRTYVYGGSVTATGGNGAAGIGGGYNCYGAAVTITNGVVVATGGAGGAGIGGGQSGGAALRGACEISGGRVTATGGAGAAGIGGGRNGASGFYVQQGGTVVAHSGSGGKDIGAGQGGTSAGQTTVSGGSLNAASAKVAPVAKNASGEKVYCVTVPIGRANFDIGAAMADFAGYSLSGAVTDGEGKIYVWLPDGKYYINLANRPYRAIVDGADAEAEVWSVGVEVDGVDVALQSGEGWTYAVDTGVLSVFADGCVISGTNTAGDVSLAFTNSLSAVVSNLCIATSSGAAASPVSILSNAVVTLAFAGTNGFTRAGMGCAGIHVPYGSTLSITNLVEDAMPYLVATGGLNAAGIGGGSGQSHGTIEIAGCVVDATGGDYATGIGSGYFSEYGDNPGDAVTLRQGRIRIAGGDVTAHGRLYAAGIGGSNRHSGGVIEITGGTVKAYGGSSAAGIGGGCGTRGHTIAISGGDVTASGGLSACGIGGGNGDASSNPSPADTDPCRISISGGRIAATGGSYASAIGAGYKNTQAAILNITGGTVTAKGGIEDYGYSRPDDIGFSAVATSAERIVYPLTIKNASVHALNRTASAEYVSPAPSNGTERVWCVTVETGKTNELARVEYLDGYGEDSEIYADEEGKVYLWLPDGSHVFYVGGEPYAATVGGADTTAHEWLTGVTADGLDVSHVQTKGKKWYYDYGEKRLYVIGDCVVSGTNTAGQVKILASPIAEDEGGTGGSFAFTVSNLHLKASSASPLAVSNGKVTVRLAGANTLDATATGRYAGLNVNASATLAITNLEENAALTARGGTDGAGIGGNRGEARGRSASKAALSMRTA